MAPALKRLLLLGIAVACFGAAYALGLPPWAIPVPVIGGVAVGWAFRPPEPRRSLPPRDPLAALPPATAPSLPFPAYHWLHLSDIHFGARGKDEWIQLVDDFERDLAKWLPRIGAPIDLILISGDLTNFGTAEEFHGFSDFLDRALTRIETITKHRPLVIPVPGNHDLIRPTDGAVANDSEAFWDSENPKRYAQLFTGYTAWLKDKVIPPLKAASGVKVHESFFPGDLTVILEDPERFALIIVGLNSAWLHDRDVEKGALALPVEQFHAALPPAPGGYHLDIFPKNGPPCALLMHHHPPSWLSPDQRAGYMRTIHTPERFAACLHGHEHQPLGSSIASGCGPHRFYFQAPSFFGIERYRQADESRIFGYAFGMIRSDGEVRLWPIRHQPKMDGSHRFDKDLKWNWNDQDEYVLARAGIRSTAT